MQSQSTQSTKPVTGSQDLTQLVLSLQTQMQAQKEQYENLFRAYQSSEQQRQRAEQLQQQAEQLRQQAEQLRQHEQQQRQGASDTPAISTSPLAMESVVQKRPKEILPKPDAFSGEDKTAYRQFELKLKAKLAIDGKALGSEHNQIWYAFGRLTGEAATRIHSWMDVASNPSYTGEFSVDALIQEMRKAFLDPAIQEKALLRLNTLKQGNRPLRDFLSEFDRLLMEAGGMMWADDIKKGYLRAAIAVPILQGMVGTAPKASYEDYCGQLRLVDDQLEQLRRITKGKERTVPTSAAVDNAAVDKMDWEPTKVQIAARENGPKKQAIRVTQGEIERRRKNQLCLRCGSADHFIRGCRLLPPPQLSKSAVAVSASIEESNEQSEKEEPLA